MSRTNLLGALPSHHRAPASWAFSADGRRLIVGYGYDEAKATAEVWQVENVRKLAVLERSYSSEVSDVALSHDGRTAFPCDQQGTAGIWDVATHPPQQLATLKGHEDWVSAIAFTPDGNTLVSAGYDGVRVWRASSLAEIDAAKEAK